MPVILVPTQKVGTDGGQETNVFEDAIGWYLLPALITGHSVGVQNSVTVP